MTRLRRILTGTALMAIASGLASADTIAYLSVPVTSSFVTDNTYSLSLPDFNPAFGTLTGATIYLKFKEDLTTLGLTNTAPTTQTFDLDVQSNILFGSTNSANNADRFTGEILDLFDTGIGPGDASLPSPEATITLGGSATGACPTDTPSAACSSVNYTPPDEVVSNTDAVYAFPTGTGLDGLLGLIKNITGADLLNYVGGGTFTLGGSTKSLTTFAGGGNNINLNVQSTAKVSAEIDYTYSIPSGTPEPATMALMGGALLGLGLIGRRLKKA